MAENLTDIQKFKKILEYFVAHLNYLCWREKYLNEQEDYKKYNEIKKKAKEEGNKLSSYTDYNDTKKWYDDNYFPEPESNVNIPGWDVIKKSVEEKTIKLTGRGYDKKYAQFQAQIKDWDKYHIDGIEDEQQICMSAQTGFQLKNSSYLHWHDESCSHGNININPIWDNNDYVEKLEVGQGKGSSYDLQETKSDTISSLGLFDGKAPNQNIISLFTQFKDFRKREYYGNFLSGTCQGILKKNYNLILSGAPGTGKTWLAYDIASHLCHGKAYSELDETEKKQIGFVQFHPSYDYTDFVEGLRPDPDTTKDGNVGFARTNGVFKEFCERALGEDNETTSYSDSIDEVDYEDLFEQAWLKLKKTLTENKTLEIPLNGKKNFTIQLNVTNEGLEDKHDSYSRYYNPNQLLKIYKGQPGVKKGGHDNYRKAIVKYLIKAYNLQEYKTPFTKNTHPSEDSNSPRKKYVFIIDEINRGELSKIFGELFFCIDKGYRGDKHKVLTQYQNLVEDDDVFADGFFIPENVYIIGTMNDIDRSVETMDFAMRRRFTFKEILASDRLVMLDDALEDDVKKVAIKSLSVLNKQIEKTLKLSSAYHVGPAYFLDLKKERYDGDFDMLWSYNIKPLLQEYMRGKNGAAEMIAKVHEEYIKASRSDTE